MAQKKSQVQNFEKAFDYTLFLGKYLPTFKCSSQNSTSVDTLLPGGAAISFSQSWNFELKFFVDNPYVKKIGTRSF